MLPNTVFTHQTLPLFSVSDFFSEAAISICVLVIWVASTLSIVWGIFGAFGLFTSRFGENNLREIVSLLVDTISSKHHIHFDCCCVCVCVWVSACVVLRRASQFMEKRTRVKENHRERERAEYHSNTYHPVHTTPHTIIDE